MMRTRTSGVMVVVQGNQEAAGVGVGVGVGERERAGVTRGVGGTRQREVRRNGTGRTSRTGRRGQDEAGKTSRARRSGQR